MIDEKFLSEKDKKKHISGAAFLFDEGIESLAGLVLGAVTSPIIPTMRRIFIDRLQRRVPEYFDLEAENDLTGASVYYRLREIAGQSNRYKKIFGTYVLVGLAIYIDTMTKVFYPEHNMTVAYLTIPNVLSAFYEFGRYRTLRSESKQQTSPSSE